MKKHTTVLAMDSEGTVANVWRGNDGCVKKFGMGAVNCKMDRRNRYTAIGPQKIGTTNHLVLVVS